MIDKKLENYYNIMISIFLGVLIIIITNMLYDRPRTIELLASKDEHFENTNHCLHF